MKYAWGFIGIMAIVFLAIGMNKLYFIETNIREYQEHRQEIERAIEALEGKTESIQNIQIQIVRSIG